MARVYRGPRAYQHKAKTWKAPRCPDCAGRRWLLDLCTAGCCPPAAVCDGCGYRVLLTD